MADAPVRLQVADMEPVIVGIVTLDGNADHHNRALAGLLREFARLVEEI